MTFEDLGLSAELLRAVNDAGYNQPTPIQEKAIPWVLQGRDVLGCAASGSFDLGRDLPLKRAASLEPQTPARGLSALTAARGTEESDELHAASAVKGAMVRAHEGPATGM